MLITQLRNFHPNDWDTECILSKYTETLLPEYSMEYLELETTMLGSFSKGIKKITKIESPYLYGSFLLKQAEYKSREAPALIRRLYHDTAEHKVHSILSTNLDWRLVHRSKYGMGVSFSPCTTYANKYSSMLNGIDRAMIVADVLVGYTKHIVHDNSIPESPFDTNIGNNGNVYVKFYDNEFYPKYVIYYNSVPYVPFGRYRR